MKGINHDRKEVLLPLIKHALQKGDTSMLQGLQTLDSAYGWTGTMGTESITAMLFHDTLKNQHEIEEKQKEFDEYAKKGMVHKKLLEQIQLLKEGYIPISRVKAGCKGLRNFIDDINVLRINGFVELYPDETNAQYIRLSSLWKNTIDNIKILGEETEVFGSSMGTLISIAIHGKGFSSLRPLIHAYETASRTGEITQDQWLSCCSIIRRPHRWIAKLVERDRKKVESIRVFERYDGVMILNKNGIKAIKYWNKLAYDHAISRSKNL